MLFWIFRNIPAQTRAFKAKIFKRKHPARRTMQCSLLVRRPISSNAGLNFNPGFFFFCSKAFSWKIFSILFRASNHHCSWGERDGAIVRVKGWVCCSFSPLLREVFLRVLRFSPLLKNQHFQIPNPPCRSQVDEEPLCGCATAKSLFILFIYKS